MSLRIARCVIDDVVAHSRQEHPREACGVLLADDGTVVATARASNVAAHPERQFEIDPSVLLACHRNARALGRTVAGWYHSHPGGPAAPSPTDAARAVSDGKVWLIAGSDGVAAWHPVAHGGAVHGRFDPLAIEIV